MSARDSAAEKLQQVHELIISRILDAPRERVWKSWTDPERFKLWWGPKGFTAPFCKIDLRVGGRYLACMRSPDGNEYWSTGVYAEIVPYDRIVYDDSFADEKGREVPASYYGFEGQWPGRTRIHLKFEEDGDRTIMTLRHVGVPPEIMDDCEAGWSSSFDKLAESLK